MFKKNRLTNAYITSECLLKQNNIEMILIFEKKNIRVILNQEKKHTSIFHLQKT